MSLLSDVILRGARASQPAATAVAAGTLYGVTDEDNIVERSNGTIWQAYSPSASGGLAAAGAALALLGADAGEDGPMGPPGPRSGSGMAAVGIVIDGGGAVITTGIKGDVRLPFACTIVSVTMLADVSGSIVVDIWKDTYANYPPTVADTITASAKPAITTATKSEDTTLTGWTVSIAAGETLRFNVDSATTITRLTLQLQVRVS